MLLPQIELVSLKKRPKGFKMSNETKAMASIVSSVLILGLIYLSGMTPGQLFLVMSSVVIVAALLGLYGGGSPVVTSSILIPINALIFVSPNIIATMVMLELVISTMLFVYSKLDIELPEGLRRFQNN